MYSVYYTKESNSKLFVRWINLFPFICVIVIKTECLSGEYAAAETGNTGPFHLPSLIN